MSDYDGGSRVVKIILMVTVAMYMVGSMYFLVQANNRMTSMEQKEAVVQASTDKKLADMSAQTGQNRASVDALAEKVGMTRQELSARAAVLQKKQHATETRLSADEESTKQQFGVVTGEVNGVKTQVTAIGADVTDTKNDLAATKGRLDSAVGELNHQAELIATNHTEVEQLKHRGERNYFEFTLDKGKQPTRISTVSLQLKKTDPRRNKFTITVYADDMQIEKKDRLVNEPLQFYTGRDHNLYEVVVNNVTRNSVSGYLSTPKTQTAAIQPPPTPQN